MYASSEVDLYFGDKICSYVEQHVGAKVWLNVSAVVEPYVDEVGQYVGDKVWLYVSAEVGLYVCD